ncbi:MAG: hypothetical protein KGD59_04820 [Candidatus Heimdallarchaeota archaeon]|nr:hypothetical protein [Candidatus Heimdallarchaeota archaeon]MBY8993851.1 hypothetical protein [Candidatus Heimdallarchaeota archaeon]
MRKNNLLRSRKIKLIAFIFIITFLLPFFVSDQVRMLTGISEEENNNGLTINAKEPLDAVDITEIGFWDDNYGQINDVSVVGNYAYLALGTEGLLIYDVTNASIPVLETYWDDYDCSYIHAAGDYIYCANNTAIYVLDAGDIDSLNLATNWSASNVRDIYGQGNFVYYTRSNGFYSYNITDLLNPTYEDHHTDNDYYDFQIDGGYAYVHETDNDQCRVINVTDPTNLVYLYFMSVSNLHDFYYADNYIYTSNQNNLWLWNFTDKSAVPVNTDTYAFNNSGLNNIQVAGNYLFIEEGDDIVLVDVSNKTNVQFHSISETNFFISDIIVKGNTVYAFDQYTFEIIDAADSMNLVILWFDQIYGQTVGLFIDGSYAFVADTTNLEILDISDPANPIRIGKFFDDGGDIIQVFARGDFAYILEAGFGLKILDVSDPTNIIEMGNVSLMGYSMWDLFVTEEYAFVSLVGDGLAIIDIFYHDSPQLIMIYDEVPVIFSAAMVDTYLLLAALDYFHVVDLTNPFNPEKLSNWTRTNAVYMDMYVVKDYAILLSWEGFDIIDITDLENPVKVGQYFTWKTPIDIFVEGKFVYMLDDAEGIDVFDLTHINHPKLIGNYDNDQTHYGISVHNSYIYLAEGINGTRVLMTDPTLSGKLPFLGPFAIFVSLTMLSVLINFIRKKKRR